MTFLLQLSPNGTILQPRLLPPEADTHKYRRGHAVVISGPALRTGASRLTAQAALAVGAGLVTLAGKPAALAEHAAHVTAIMLREIDPSLSVIDARVKAAAVGPGAGVSAELLEIISVLLEKGVPLVIDADAVTALADSESALNTDCVLTPHAGEFARLFPQIAPDAPLDAAIEAALQSGAVVALKGPETAIASPTGQFAVNRHAAPWLATAGSGDVLTGLVCGLLAQGLDSFTAACVAAWIHGDIGVRAGPGLTADRMIDYIPLVLHGCLHDAEADGAGSRA